MTLPLRVLLLSDSQDCQQLLLEELYRGGYAPICWRVETIAAMQMALKQQSWDVVISTALLPDVSALNIWQQLQAWQVDLPLIVLTEAIDPPWAATLGDVNPSHGLVLAQLPELISTIERELYAVDVRQQRRQLEQRLLKLAMLVQTSTQGLETADSPDQSLQDEESQIGESKRFCLLDSPTHQEIFDAQLLDQLHQELAILINQKLHTPLVSLQSAIDLLLTREHGQLSESGRRMLQLAATNVDRLLQLAIGILDFEESPSETPSATPTKV